MAAELLVLDYCHSRIFKQYHESKVHNEKVKLWESMAQICAKMCPNWKSNQLLPDLPMRVQLHALLASILNPELERFKKLIQEDFPAVSGHSEANQLQDDYNKVYIEAHIQAVLKFPSEEFSHKLDNFLPRFDVYEKKKRTDIVRVLQQILDKEPPTKFSKQFLEIFSWERFVEGALAFLAKLEDALPIPILHAVGEKLMVADMPSPLVQASLAQTGSTVSLGAGKGSRPQPAEEDTNGAAEDVAEQAASGDDESASLPPKRKRANKAKSKTPLPITPTPRVLPKRPTPLRSGPRKSDVSTTISNLASQSAQLKARGSDPLDKVDTAYKSKALERHRAAPADCAEEDQDLPEDPSHQSPEDGEKEDKEENAENEEKEENEEDDEDTSNLNLPTPKAKAARKLKTIDPDFESPMRAKRIKRNKWSEEEVAMLIEGVKMFGEGNWSQMRDCDKFEFVERSSVDLKDKWRNILLKKARTGESVD